MGPDIDKNIAYFDYDDEQPERAPARSPSSAVASSGSSATSS